MGKATRKTVSSKRREALVACGFLAPNLIGFLLFTSLPVVISLVMSFTHWNIFRPPTWVGLQNYGALLCFHREHARLVPNDPLFWQYVGNTLFLMMGIPVGMAGSLITALMMNRKVADIRPLATALLILGLLGDLVWNGLSYRLITCGLIICAVYWLALRVHFISKQTGMVALRTLYFLPTVCSGVAMLILWKYLYNSDIGLINETLRGIGVSNPPDWLGTVAWAKPALMIMGFWGALGGVNSILYLAALQGVPSSYYEAADIDGAGPWAKFWSVTWPMISPTTFFILIMSIIGGFQSGFMVANIMTGGGPAGSTKTVEYCLYQTAFEKFNMGYASAIAWFLFAVILVITLCTWRVGGRVVTYE